MCSLEPLHWWWISDWFVALRDVCLWESSTNAKDDPSSDVDWRHCNLFHTFQMTTENTCPSVNSAGSFRWDVMLYYKELCTVNKQLEQTSNVSGKELTFLSLDAHQEGRFMEKKAKLAHFRHWWGIPHCLFCLGRLCQVLCVSVFPACFLCFMPRQRRVLKFSVSI